jgi:hypothetical protein
MRAIRSPRCRVGIQPTPLREAPSYSDSDASQPHPPAIPACAAASRSQGWIPAFTAKEVARLFSVLSACTRSRSRLITHAPHPASPRKEAGRGDGSRSSLRMPPKCHLVGDREGTAVRAPSPRLFAGRGAARGGAISRLGSRESRFSPNPQAVSKRSVNPITAFAGMTRGRIARRRPR